MSDDSAPITEYQSFDDVRAAGDTTRDIAVLMHKARSSTVRGSSSLDNLPSHRLLEPELGRALDFAKPGGFRRQYMAAASGQEPVLAFYSAFAAYMLSLSHRGAATILLQGEEGPPARKAASGVWYTILAILKSFVGSAVLFLPKGYDNGGLLLSNALLILMALITVFCINRLIECAQMLERRGRGQPTYGEIAAVSMGPLGASAVNASLVLSQMGFCCGYIIFIASNLRDAAALVWGGGHNGQSNSTAGAFAVLGSGEVAGMRTVAAATAVDNVSLPLPLPSDALDGRGWHSPPPWLLIAAQLPLFVGLSWVRRLSYFAISNLIADGLILFGLVAIFGCAAYHCFFFPMPTVRLVGDRFPLFLGTAAFAFEGIGLVLPIFASMEPRLRPQLPAIIARTLAFVVLLFCLFASTVYAAFGKDVQIIVTANLPVSLAVPVQLAYSAALALTFPIMLFPVVHIIEERLAPHSSLTHPHLKWRKNALRGALVLSAALVAWLGFDTLDNFVALIGGFCSVPLAIVYPTVMHTLLARTTDDGFTMTSTLSIRSAVANWVVGSVGVAVCITASAFAIVTWPR